MENKGKQYNKSPYPLHGNLYETYLLIYCIVKSIKNKDKFNLTTQWSYAGKFDDLVYELIDPDTDKTYFTFLQAKHTQSAGEKITDQSLLANDSKPFALKKYFHSYLKIKKNIEDDVNGRNELKQLILFTNMGIKDNFKRPSFEEDAKFENILSFNNGERLKLKLKGNDTYVNKLKAYLKEDSDDDGIDEKIETFLNLLTFYVNQPNVNDLYEIINEEIKSCDLNISTPDNHKMTKLQDYVFRWMIRQDGTSITEETIRNFFDEMKRECVRFNLIDGSKTYLNNLKNTTIGGVEFNSTTMKNLHWKWEGILGLRSDNVKFTLLKINQSINDLDIIVMNNERRIDQCIDTLKFANVLMIVEIEKIREHTEKIFAEIGEILLKNRRWVIFLYTAENFEKKFKTLFQTIAYKDVNDLTDLSDETQENLLKTKILLQGNEIRLSDILFNDNCKTLLNGRHLWNLLNKKQISIGDAIKNLDDAFIERKFIQKRINEKILERNNSFYRVNNSLHAPKSLIKNKDLLCISRVPINWSTCKLKNNIHWLQPNENALIWKATRGSITNLVNYLNDEVEVATPNGNFNIISAEVGMGKTVLFDYLVRNKKKENPTFWTWKINFNDLNFPNECSVENRLSEAMNLKNPLIRNLLKEELTNRGNVTLFFDGYDEIDEDYREEAKRFLKKLRDNYKTKEIWISTRPLYKKELENYFDSLSYDLKPFDRDEQKRIFAKYIKDVKKIDSIMNTLSISKKYKKCIMENPLHVRMIATIITDGYIIPETFNLLELYERFVEKKFEIYFNEKMKLNDGPNANYGRNQLKRIFMEQHEQLALRVLFRNNKILSTYNNKEQPDRIITNVGLINYFHRNYVKFVHYTFAEYFVAKWLLKNKNETKVKNFLIQNYFTNKRMDLIRVFIEEMSLKQNEKSKISKIFSYIWHKQDDLLESISDKNVKRRDHFGRTVLHMACYYGNPKTIEILLNNKVMPNNEDDYFQLTPWEILMMKKEKRIRRSCTNLNGTLGRKEKMKENEDLNKLLIMLMRESFNSLSWKSLLKNKRKPFQLLFRYITLKLTEDSSMIIKIEKVLFKIFVPLILFVLFYVIFYNILLKL